MKNVDTTLSDNISKLMKSAQAAPEPIGAVDNPGVPAGVPSQPNDKEDAVEQQVEIPQPPPEEEVSVKGFDRLIASTNELEYLLNRIIAGEPTSARAGLTLVKRLKGEILALRDAG